MGETDALDYCNEQVVARYCYESELYYPFGRPLEAYKLAYRKACKTGNRLEEWAFEDMWGLPRGTMDRLKAYVKIVEGVDAGPWQEVKHDITEEGNLGFILKGSVSLVQILPIVDQRDLFGSVIRGFNFREGKRLRRRYPPGHVVGKVSFFLKPRN